MTAITLELPFIHEDPYLRAARGEERLKAYEDKMRKAMFAKLGEKDKKINELESRLNILESGLCTGKWEFRLQ